MSYVTYRRQPTLELLACFIEILFHYMPYQRVRSGIITAVRFIRTGRINKQYAQVSLQLHSVTYRNNACFNRRIKYWLDNATVMPQTVSHMSNYTRFARCEVITAVLLNSRFFWTVIPYRLVATLPTYRRIITSLTSGSMIPRSVSDVIPYRSTRCNISGNFNIYNSRTFLFVKQYNFQKFIRTVYNSNRTEQAVLELTLDTADRDNR